ncbi:hypothetical protein [Arthrobacter gengyunqii]|uniref:Uncharacterized protein n=1 Tax=Arthrobacter gengyunqii TaxID=2886940 RepID=A0ABS8GDI3_9MICC|nr:hypothetical protein [Arthrobacter gengyunqii]MCC3264676.1 hypothetical protein [Arthrobacter gengyunqii]
MTGKTNEQHEQARTEGSDTANDARRRTFQRLCSDYEEYFDSISDLLEELVPHVEQLDGSAQEVSRLFGSSNVDFSNNDRLAIATFFRDNLTRTVSLREMINILFDKHFDTAWGQFLINALHKHVTYSPKLPILTNSLITSIIGGFEVALAKTTTEYYRASPNALLATPKDRQKEFSLQDLKQLGSIEEAVEAAIASRVDDLLFGSLAGWRRFYKDKMNIDFSELSIDWATTDEIFQRRHIIVHNGGRASTRYINSTGRTDITKDELIASDDRYVRMALDHLFVLGYLVTAAAWEKFTDSPGESCDDVQRMGYVLLTRRRWQAAKRISSFGVDHATDSLTAHMCQVNAWIAEKGMKGLGSIEKAVRAWDVSALSKDFQLAKYCLLDDLDKAFDMLPPMLEANTIGGESLLEWPLLEGVRADARFLSLKEYVKRTLDDEVQHVYQLPGGHVYHLPSCQRRGAGAERVVMTAAVDSGARPCKSCHPKEKAA